MVKSLGDFDSKMRERHWNIVEPMSRYLYTEYDSLKIATFIPGRRGTLLLHPLQVWCVADGAGRRSPEDEDDEAEIKERIF